MSTTLQTPTPALPGNPDSEAVCAPKQRDILIDVVRGLAISLVVLGHTNEGILHRNWWGSSPLGTRLDIGIYSFHMPAFFFVSGLFLRPSIAKRGPWRFTREKIGTLLYPYVLWALLATLVVRIFAHFTNQPPESWSAFLLALVTGYFSWFLPTLFFVMMLGMVTRRLPAWLFFATAVLLNFVVPFTSGLSYFQRGIEELPYFAAGVWVATSYRRLEQIPVPVAALIAALLLAVIAFCSDSPHWGHHDIILALGFAGTLMLLLIARCLGNSAIARGLAWTGSASLGVFLMSAYFQGAGRALLQHFAHTASPLPQLIFPTLLAVILPAWLYHQRKRLHMEWMFQWPF